MPRTVDPVLVFAFLEALLAVLADYYGTAAAPAVVTEHLIKDNFDTVLLLLEEMLGGTGRQPLVSEPATLKELVTPPNLVAKLLSAATAALGESSSNGRGATGAKQMPLTNNQALSSPLPWRKQGIRHKVSCTTMAFARPADVRRTTRSFSTSSRKWARLWTGASCGPLLWTRMTSQQERPDRHERDLGQRRMQVQAVRYVVITQCDGLV